MAEIVVNAPSSFRRRWSAWAAPAAGVWSLVFGLVGAYWAFGGSGFPFGHNDSRARQVGSLFGAAEPGATGAVIAALGLLGVVAALVMNSSVRTRLPLVFASAMALGLIVIVPDIRVVQNFGYLFMGYTGLWDGPLLYMLFCIGGGALWGAAAKVYGSRLAGGFEDSARRSRAAARWGRWATYAAAVFALPYGIVRLAWAVNIPLGVPAGFLAGGSGAESAKSSLAWLSEFVLGGLCVGGAILTLGLIQRWGEIFPRWIPYLRGRRVSISLAVVPALCAAAMMIEAGLRILMWVVTGEVTIGADTWGMAGPGLFWLPWGTALATATYAYYLRRRGTAG
ncbi:hypothetical protein ACQPYK_48030 [Streptosporangium sp. CA-135522]|uniref:hypothetical protein n=1 Tax=Streptosporangium sp. CA-135522 TaxID=3240072 RepID=UPI003D8B1782